MTVQHIGMYPDVPASQNLGALSIPVLAKFRNEESDEAKEQIFEKLHALLRGIPAIKDIHVGPPVLPGGARGFDFGTYQGSVGDPAAYLNIHCV